MRVRPLWSVVLYVLLVASAGLALWVQRAGGPAPLAAAAPWLFLTFAVGFAVYRLALVVAKRYPAFKAFSQIFIAALFFVVLLFPSLEAARAPAPSLPVLLRDGDARVRALAAEVAGFRGEQGAVPRLLELLDDASPTVRDAAHGALVRLNGVDLGPADDAAARKAWRERLGGPPRP